MAETKTILVAGATGQQGGTVARSLLKRGHRVIGLTRSASKLKGLAAAGIEGVQGDLTQRASLTPLVRNVDGFFVVTTPFEPDFSVHPEKEVLQGTTAIDAAKAASMRHVVLSSVAAADRNTGIPHFESKAKGERYMRASRVPNTIVRPVAFMDNYASPWMTSSLQRGIMEVPLPPTTRQQLVAVKDIGEFVARAFDDPNSAIGKTVELAGEETRTSDSICRAARGRGPEENGRRRIPNVPVLQDGRIPRRHPRSRGRLGLPHDPVPRVPRRRGLAEPRLRPVAYRAVERPDSRSFCAAACGSSRRAATSSASFLNAPPELEPSETRRTRRRCTFSRISSRARATSRFRRPPLWSRYNACFSIAPARSSIPRPSRAPVRMIGGVHPSRVSSWNFRLATRTSSLPRSTLFTT